MDSSIENAALIAALEELGKDGLLKAMAEARCESNGNLMRHLAKERQRKAQDAHGRRPK